MTIGHSLRTPARDFALPSHRVDALHSPGAIIRRPQADIAPARRYPALRKTLGLDLPADSCADSPAGSVESKQGNQQPGIPSAPVVGEGSGGKTRADVPPPQPRTPRLTTGDQAASSRP